MSFQPGNDHPMDAQLTEARNLRQEIIAQIEEVQSIVAELAALDDPARR
jgi:hypothetical protein